ncbi:MAG: ABC transporter permease [Candidatus Sericytochromatia bacterium]|nr:ABC transporter permease [Candidatus Tanganyikabacteria bacterium]
MSQDTLSTTPPSARPAADALPPPIPARTRFWRRFRKHRPAFIALWLLLAVYLVMALADVFAPYSPLSEDRNRAFQPPAEIHLRDDSGNWHAPFIYDRKKQDDYSAIFEAGAPATMTLGEWQEDRTVRHNLAFWVKGEPYRILGLVPGDRHVFGIEGQAAPIYLLGADNAGRDQFSRLLFGARVSLTVGIIALLIVIPVGTLVGGAAGYFGGWIDTVLMWLVETVLAFPTFYLLLALFGVTYKWDITPTQRFYVITIILSFLGWAGLARVIRGMVLSLKHQEYIEAARAAGAGHLWIITRHLLPQTATWVVISVSLSIPGYIYGESVLSLLGLGVQPPDASWGNMLEPALNVSDLVTHPWLLAPGVAIVFVTVAWNFLGDGLRDAFDSKRRV